MSTRTLIVTALEGTAMADGDAGNNYLQSIVNFGADDTDAGMTESEVNAFAEGAKGLRQMAESGGWAISEEGGTHFMNALKEAQTTAQGISHRLDRLAEAPKLGTDEYAKQVGKHMLTALNSDDRSLLPAFEKFNKGLDDVRTALEVAINNYNESDQETVERFNAFGIERD